MDLISAHLVSLKCNNDSTLPRDLQEQYKEWLGDNEVHPSFQLLEGIFKSIGLRDPHVREMRGNLTHLNGSRRCLRKIKHDTDNISERSLCPYHFLLSHDKNRYPTIINTARCTCNKVWYLQSTEKKCDCKKDRRKRKCKRVCNRKIAGNILTPVCTEIPYRYKVLKQKYDQDGNKLCDESNNFLYLKTYESVAIGCIAVFPKADTESTNKRLVSEK